MRAEVRSPEHGGAAQHPARLRGSLVSLHSSTWIPQRTQQHDHRFFPEPQRDRRSWRHAGWDTGSRENPTREVSMATSTIDGELLETLSASFSGTVLLPEDDGYDEARLVHNGLIDRRPALIARCQGTADIAEAIGLARASSLEISVRGGGHNVAGRAVADGGLMIDLVGDEGNPCRRVGANRARTGRCDVEGAEPGDAPPRARRHRRCDLVDGDRRLHPRRRARLADGEARARGRQPARRRARDGGRRDR